MILFDVEIQQYFSKTKNNEGSNNEKNFEYYNIFRHYILFIFRNGICTGDTRNS